MDECIIIREVMGRGKAQVDSSPQVRAIIRV